MEFDHAARRRLLAHAANAYLGVIDDNIQREYPYMPWMVVDTPEPLPSHRELHPVFYGCFDWHSCVEMWWAAIRLIGTFPGLPHEPAIRNTMDTLLTAPHVGIELAFLQQPRHAGFERPYGWSWLLTLQHELDGWDDPDGQRWASILRPLADHIAAGFVAWLPKLTYPQRYGMHANTAFALLRSLDFAEARAAGDDPGLLDAITNAADRFYRNDTDYPARYEPSGADFLSGALTEAELMSRVLPTGTFPAWLDAFLPGLADGEPAELFTPAFVSDATDGQIAHLSGLNLSRAAGFLGIAAALDDGDARVPVLTGAAARHADASLGAVTGSDYMQEHWLAAYATLMLTT